MYLEDYGWYLQVRVKSNCWETFPISNWLIIKNIHKIEEIIDVGNKDCMLWITYNGKTKRLIQDRAGGAIGWKWEVFDQLGKDRYNHLYDTCVPLYDLLAKIKVET